MPDDKQQQDSESGSPILRDFALFGLIVGDLLGYTGAGIGLGWWLWKKLGVPWWIFLVTTGAGLYLAMTRIYKRSRS